MRLFKFIQTIRKEWNLKTHSSRAGKFPEKTWAGVWKFSTAILSFLFLMTLLHVPMSRRGLDYRFKVTMLLYYILAEYPVLAGGKKTPIGLPSPSDPSPSTPLPHGPQLPHSSIRSRYLIPFSHPVHPIPHRNVAPLTPN
jgi:hypothetical protein